MTRPTYETSADRAREHAVAERLAHLACLEPRKMPRAYPVDYVLYDPDQKRVKAWLEIKCRTNPKDQYPTYMLSYAKLLSMAHIQMTSGIPCRLAVQWSDALGTLSIPSPHTTSFGGRADREDWQDHEPVALFPISNFTVVG